MQNSVIERKANEYAKRYNSSITQEVAYKAFIAGIEEVAQLRWIDNAVPQCDVDVIIAYRDSHGKMKYGIASYFNNKWHTGRGEFTSGRIKCWSYIYSLVKD